MKRIGWPLITALTLGGWSIIGWWFLLNIVALFIAPLRNETLINWGAILLARATEAKIFFTQRRLARSLP